jgi:adenylosuccinate synthase
MDRRKNKLVIGLGCGDEGKGVTTDYLCNQASNPIVIRANGGFQCGHTVIHEGNRHVFSNFGSGTLKGHPTYWSEYCPFSPVGVLNEFNSLKKIKGLEPKLYVHPLSPVSTPYEKKFNCQLDKVNQHGSCGVGFGQTIQRQEDHYKLFVQDLFYESTLIQKLLNIKSYYAKKFAIEPKFLDDTLNINIDDFLYVVNEIKKIITVDNGSMLDLNYDLIFEGGQGVLLDQDFGFFPNVTRSNTTSKNPLEFIKNNNLFSRKTEIYYITRAYQTRHGNGFMTNEGLFDLSLKNNELETNVTNEWQGNFRKSVLDLDLLNYALQCDSNFSSGITKNLVITCVDQTGDVIPATINNELHYIHVEELPTYLNCKFDKLLICRGDSGIMSEIHDYSNRTKKVSA